MNYRIIFMGSHDFSCDILDALLESTHDIIAVYTQPAKAAGRKKCLKKSPIHEMAEARGLKIETPLNFKETASIETFKNFQADIAIVAAYGLILPKAVLEAPKRGCINLHVSLLPKWRGASPIQHAILNGDKKTGLTIMQMDEGMDTGAILLQETMGIPIEMTSLSCFDAMGKSAKKAILQILDRLPTYQEAALPQDNNLASYAPKITREDGKINWRNSAEKILQQFKAFYPWPGIYTCFEGKNYKIHGIEMRSSSMQIAMPGELISEDGLVLCGDKTVLKILSIQPPGKKPMGFKDFFRGKRSCEIGSIFQ